MWWHPIRERLRDICDFIGFVEFFDDFVKWVNSVAMDIDFNGYSAIDLIPLIGILLLLVSYDVPQKLRNRLSRGSGRSPMVSQPPTEEGEQPPRTSRPKTRHQASQANSLEQIRSTNKVSALLYIEQNKQVTLMPCNRYGFVEGWRVETYDGLTVAPRPAFRWVQAEASGQPGNKDRIEIHKLADGEIILVGFVCQSDLANFNARDNEKEFSATMFFQPFEEFNKVFSIPALAISHAKHRALDNDCSVFDLTIQAADEETKA